MCKLQKQFAQGMGTFEGEQLIYLIKIQFQVANEEFTLNPTAISVTCAKSLLNSCLCDYLRI